ncbi:MULTISPECIES: lipoprotein-releasing ABC transporter permease subunit [Thalassospira]|jgi:lipoprotein-releasing system permease protein|uniref:Multidrug ABC transporter substrate-binding protein n=2 Tax=Thalassospira xiamenensis TaxID=220697 RepID=A0ABR5Y3N8_9PROT|nr:MULTISPECIES: lipoprotein-releasing ABC transporter permease subunit [Thalassospira]MBR9780975.1 lipoprotein-releasing ABC transporter permease subunit [Rhodospirillales bacterium]PTB87570.1 lipoprotein-releasing system transmembrane subunit LolC [Pseudidiomarina aestuarii]AJD52222.1 lipoprotein-releasing system permease [Thalassospira xiamenensis M-5 = DSM 17429]KZD05020.1 multidrug ABC transporter substrate-binding protein [Thalassospira xiamenensis]KZD11712.1 multidrug ABC transporter su|tara:strand:- start:945 stop:2195 length:1251 start_codon:yes stop_codon:yes gene_type:complete
MFSPFERLVAFRYLRPRRQEGFVSVIAIFSLLGIMLGVATLIIVMSVMNGFRAELLGRILGLNGHISVYAQSPDGLPNYDAIEKKIAETGNVTLVTPVVEGQVLASNNGRSTGAIVRGVRAEDIAKRKTIADNIVFGSLDDFKGDDSVIMGARLAMKLGVGVGDNVNLISPKGNVTAFGSVPRVRAYKVVGLFDIGMYEYDSGFIFMPLQAAQIYFRLPEKISHFEVMLEDPSRLSSSMNDLLSNLSGEQLRLVNWQQSNSGFFNALQVERNVMFLILTLIILVAAFNIISGMVMLVKDKGRDIAILRTMGATRSSVMRIFFLAGASIGVLGTLSGLILGVLFCLNIENIRQFIQTLTGTDLFNAEIYFLSQLPADMDISEVVLVCVMSLSLSFLATVYPAWRASRLDPVEALRYE